MPTAEAISELGPFGAGNPKPTLATAWVDVVSEPRCVGKQRDHLQATFSQNGIQIKGIGFGLGDDADHAGVPALDNRPSAKSPSKREN